MILARASFFMWHFRPIKGKSTKRKRKKRIITIFLWFQIMHITRSRSKITPEEQQCSTCEQLTAPRSQHWPQFRDQNALRSSLAPRGKRNLLTNKPFFFFLSHSLFNRAEKSRSTVTLHRHRA